MAGWVHYTRTGHLKVFTKCDILRNIPLSNSTFIWLLLSRLGGILKRGPDGSNSGALERVRHGNANDAFRVVNGDGRPEVEGRSIYFLFCSVLFWSMCGRVKVLLNSEINYFCHVINNSANKFCVKMLIDIVMQNLEHLFNKLFIHSVKTNSSSRFFIAMGI